MDTKGIAKSVIGVPRALVCFPGVEGYSAGWIAGGSSFLISLQMKSSISMSER